MPEENSAKGQKRKKKEEKAFTEKKRSAAAAAVCGFLIGSTMSVPGVSGGTTALALGCYERILTAATGIRKKENLRYLFLVGCGGAVGFFLFARVIAICFSILPLTMTLLFAGAAGAGAVQLLKEEPPRRFREWLTVFAGAAVVVGIDLLPEVEKIPFWLLFPFGIVLAAGIILPGISTSHLLWIFGVYQTVTHPHLPEDFKILLPIALGAAAGILLTASPLEKALKTTPGLCIRFLSGCSFGSLYPLFDALKNDPQIAYAPKFQIINGLILGAGAYLWIRSLHKRENMT